MAAKRIKRGSGGARTTEPCIYQQALDRLSGEAGVKAILRHEDVRTRQRSYIKTVLQVVTNTMKQLEAKMARAAVVQQVPVN